MVPMMEIACSRRIGLGPRKLGFKCGCVISGEVMANTLSRDALGTADEPACSAVVFSKAKPDSDDVVHLNENAELCNLDGSSFDSHPRKCQLAGTC